MCAYDQTYERSRLLSALGKSLIHELDNLDVHAIGKNIIAEISNYKAAATKLSDIGFQLCSHVR